MKIWSQFDETHESCDWLKSLWEGVELGEEVAAGTLLATVRWSNNRKRQSQERAAAR